MRQPTQKHDEMLMEGTSCAFVSFAESLNFGKSLSTAADGQRHQLCHEEIFSGQGVLLSDGLRSPCGDHTKNLYNVILQVAVVTPISRNILGQPRNLPKNLQPSWRSVVRTLSGGIIFTRTKSPPGRHFCAQSALFSIKITIPSSFDPVFL